MCNNTQKKKAAGAGKDFTLFFGVMLHFNFKCAVHGFHLKLPSTNISNKYTCIGLTCYLKFCYQEFINACSDGMGSSIGSL